MWISKMLEDFFVHGGPKYVQDWLNRIINPLSQTCAASLHKTCRLFDFLRTNSS
jgi:hypothetical protein